MAISTFIGYREVFEPKAAETVAAA
jgi:hypothetical protein